MLILLRLLLWLFRGLLKEEMEGVDQVQLALLDHLSRFQNPLFNLPGLLLQTARKLLKAL
jgi:hypothetical protein